jgi:site-specific recombinase XerD
VQVCTESKSALHAAEYEGSPRRRPFTREELQALFDHADAQVGNAVSGGRKGAVAAFRDAVVLKVVYAWGLRRREAVMLDVVDWHPNPAAVQLGRFGALHVRYGKAMRGSPPRRRTVLSVLPWAVEAVSQYLESVRPLLAGPKDAAMCPTERGSRLSGRALNDRMAAYRAAVGLPEELDLHALRHSYVTQLIEDGFPERFVSEQVGHAYAATTALYTNVSDDFKNRTLAKALTRAFTPPVVHGLGGLRPTRARVVAGPARPSTAAGHHALRSLASKAHQPGPRTGRAAALNRRILTRRRPRSKPRQGRFVVRRRALIHVDGSTRRRQDHPRRSAAHPHGHLTTAVRVSAMTRRPNRAAVGMASLPRHRFVMSSGTSRAGEGCY